MTEKSKDHHIPVLLSDVIQMAKTMDSPLKAMLDGTFGRGGHSQALKEEFPELKIVGVDRDLSAIEYGRNHFDSKSFLFVQSDFTKVSESRSEWEPFIGGTGFDFILLDLGVSSPQLDNAERGFSFYHNGPLDMRMNQNDEVRAADIVNHWGEEELVELFQNLGEVRRPRRVVHKIIDMRKEQEFTTTFDLARLIEKVEGWGKRGFHPATKYFMALRLEVNKELDMVENCIPTMIDLLNPNGRFVVITFHSLEDRIVKRAFKSLPTKGQPVNKKVIQAKWEEKKKNSRARSAKLRAFQREGLQ